MKELFTNLMPTFRSLNRTTHRWVRFLNECYALNMARCQSCWINKIENTLYFSISMILCHLYRHLASNLISQNASDVRSNEPPPRQHNLYSSIDSDVMIDQSGLPIEGRRTRSQTHSVSSTSSTLMASNVSNHKDKLQCQTCLKYYGKYYLPKHMMKCNKNI